MTTFKDGNRLPLPSQAPSQHFFYKTLARSLTKADVALVVVEAKALVERDGLHAGQIEVYGGRQMSEPSSQALERLCSQATAAVGLPCKFDVVVCEQAFPHVDADFAGKSFLSVVLHTGPQPYHLQMFHTALLEDGTQDLVTSSRLVYEGDWVVFDPTTPHSAIPRHSDNESLLVLLQAEIEDNDEEQRTQLFRSLPPMGEDRDVHDLAYA